MADPTASPSLIIPDFKVTDDDSEQVDSHPTPSQGLSSPTSAGFLSPYSPLGYNRTSPDVPASPTATENDSISVPPSPTLTHSSSVHFQTSLALRDNKVDASSGTSSLGLLHPTDSSSGYGHRRKGSNATFVSTESTEPDTHRANEVELQHVKTNATSVTHVNASRSPSKDTRRTADSDAETAVSKSSKKKNKKKKGSEKEEEDARQELLQDADVDPAPFHFKPFELAQLLDPKNLNALEALGGVDGLLRGLGTSRDSGLSKQTAKSSTTKSEHGAGATDGRPGAGDGASHRHEPQKDAKTVPDIVLTEPSGQVKPPTHTDAPFTASSDDRRRVFGENVLPQRQSKSLLQLMFTALKDKVLVCHIYFDSYLLLMPNRYCFLLLPSCLSHLVSSKILVRHETHPNHKSIGLKVSLSWSLLLSL